VSDRVQHHRLASGREPGWVGGVEHVFALVFLRDCHPVLRDPLDLFRLSFPIGALIYALLGDWATRCTSSATTGGTTTASTSPCR
jgi:hypothetical protein